VRKWTTTAAINWILSHSTREGNLIGLTACSAMDYLHRKEVEVINE